jgi:catechol 1,2-dioxygenase
LNEPTRQVLDFAMIRNPDDLTNAVLAVMRQTPEPRLREIMVSLVTHLHGFVNDVKLTEDEFTNDSHNEVVLMAGSLGVSSLVNLQNHAADSTHNLLGPFWRLNSPRAANGASIVRSPTPGMPMHVRAQVVDAAGVPVSGAEVDVWHCDATGLYENQAEARAKGHADMNLRGKFTTDADGRFSFWSIKPVGYPIPTDGVVGPMLKAQQRHAMRPAHVHALVVKPGFQTLISQVYAHDDPNLATDVQFGVTPTLTGQFVQHVQAPADRPDLQLPWCGLDFVFRMEAGESKLPKAPIK